MRYYADDVRDVDDFADVSSMLPSRAARVVGDAARLMQSARQQRMRA